MAKGTNGSTKSLSDRDKKLLYIAGAVLVLVLAYVFGFQKMQEKRLDLENENVTLEAEVKRLTGMVAGKAQVIADTQEYKNAVEDTLKEYPAEVRTQTIIAYFEDMEKEIRSLNVESETFTMNQIFFQNGASVVDAASTASTDTTGDTKNQETASTGGCIGYRSDVVATFKGSCDTLKKVIDFVNKSKKRVTISELSVSNEKGEANLQCSMTISMYSVAGVDKEYRDEEYSDPDIPARVRIHKSNIFSSKN